MGISLGKVQYFGDWVKIIELKLAVNLQGFADSITIIIRIQRAKMDEESPSFFDVSKLSSSSRRKYQSYFRLNCKDDELDQKIKEHFDNELKVEANEVIEKFLELKKQDKQKRRQRNARTPVNS